MQDSFHVELSTLKNPEIELIDPFKRGGLDHDRKPLTRGNTAVAWRPVFQNNGETYSPFELPKSITADDVDPKRKTYQGVERAIKNGTYEEPDAESKYGYHLGRRIIGRDSPINGGVYLGGGPREAIVVDDTKSKYLNQIYDELLRETASAIQNGTFKNIVLEKVYRKAQQWLPYNLAQTEAIAAPHNNDQKVNIDLFLGAKSGVCRHEALLAGYLLERLGKDGYIGGTASIDRNSVGGKGGHAWVRYTNSTGRVYIIDPAQDFIGSLADILDEDQRWFYNRIN